jgi:hypothetical protein
MSNIISFRSRERSVGEAISTTSTSVISSAVTESDGAAFAVASNKGWLTVPFSDLAVQLEAALRTLEPELAAAQMGLSAPFVHGFACQQAQPMRQTAARLTVELSLTAAGLEADSFCWKNESEVVELR